MTSSTNGDGTRPSPWLHDPDAVLDYKFPWGDFLPTGDMIVSHTLTPQTGLTVNSSLLTDSARSVTVWISAASATIGTTYTLECHIVSAEGRADDRTAYFRIKEK